VAFARPVTESSLRPRFRIVFIMPGIEIAAPERTDTSRGFFWSPNFLPVSFSIILTLARRSFINPAGIFRPAL